ncbi:uncharacterized protein LOC100212474 isoform X4 [Hydra vulgaris]|uniref:Uncharacterized protein LOC100212474 isoform X4 n=2 Tax=Hydra vulgaris TaxID=6087 RepID=A0ABM4BQE9_HYDVU
MVIVMKISRDFETMLQISLSNLQFSPNEQEKIFWSFLKFLNQLETEECNENDDMNEALNGSLSTDDSYGIFWDEYRVIEQSTNQSSFQKNFDVEDGALKKEENNETKIQWLSDVGFTNIAKKFREKTEIDHNDVDMRIITASLTRAQANAVRQRIDALNEAIRQSKLRDENPRRNHLKSKHKDVRDLFQIDSCIAKDSQLSSQNSAEESKSKFIKIPISSVSSQKPDLSKHEFERSKNKECVQEGVRKVCEDQDFIKNDYKINKQTKKEDNLVLCTAINNFTFKTGQQRNETFKAGQQGNEVPNQNVSRPRSLIMENDKKYNLHRKSSEIYRSSTEIKETNTEDCIKKTQDIFENKFVHEQNSLPNSLTKYNSSPKYGTTLLLEQNNSEQNNFYPNIQMQSIESLNNNRILTLDSSSNLSPTQNVLLSNLHGTDDKRLVRVDSNYIKVSYVEDSYITTNKCAEPSPKLQLENKLNIIRTKHDSSNDKQYSPILCMRNSLDILNHSGSEDSKSLSSRGSMESFDELSISKNESTYDTVSISSGLTDDKDTSESFEFVESPLVLDGDAKLAVGSVAIKDDKSLPEKLLGPTFPPLPNFTLTHDEIGITRIGDLSELDMIKIRSLALMELTALFDEYSISMNRRKSLPKQRYKETGVFGVPLTLLVEQNDKKAQAPQVLQDMISYIEKNGLNEEGILRVTGSLPRIKQIKEDLEKDFQSFRWNGVKICDVCTCLKQFLRELPIPLLSYEYQNTFAAVANLPNRKDQLQALNLLVLLLHPVHQETLKLILLFLQKVVSHEATSKMGLNNVAMIMAPNLFFQNNSKINTDEAQKAVGMTDVLRMLIKYQNILWTIPSFMVTQIRYLYEAGANTKDQKSVKKIIARRIKNNLFGRRGKSSESSGDELDDLIIRVRAPSFNKQSMAIQLTDKTTAADIIAKFQWRRQNSIKDEIDKSKCNKIDDADVEYCLCETGGNIGERILDPSSNISAILKVNPNVEWLLKVYPSG